VQALLAAGEAAWCHMIRLELWNGARGTHEKRILREFDRFIACLPIDELVWNLSIELAQRARANGLSVPADDLIIVACARRHGVVVEHCDEHFRRLEELSK
jgi:predicted nucleic acid-binding protein